MSIAKFNLRFPDGFVDKIQSLPKHLIFHNHRRTHPQNMPGGNPRQPLGKGLLVDALARLGERLFALAILDQLNPVANVGEMMIPLLILLMFVWTWRACQLVCRRGRSWGA